MCSVTYHDPYRSIKAADSVLKPPGLHVGFSEEYEERGNRFDTSGSL